MKIFSTSKGATSEQLHNDEYRHKIVQVEKLHLLHGVSRKRQWTNLNEKHSSFTNAHIGRDISNKSR